MHREFDEKVNSEVIVLSNLINAGYLSIQPYYDSRRMRWIKKDENPNKSEQEIEAEIKEEIKNNTITYKNESLKYYQIENEKNKELEQKFKQIKLKVNFNSQPKILRDEKFYTISQGIFAIYDDKFFNKTLELKLGKNNITSAIQLDNKDLVFFAKDKLIIYRIKNEKYFLFQKINENRAGYGLQMSYSRCMGYPKEYKAKFIKEISGNRFICVSNYGYKIYALNEKKEYSIVLLESYHESIKTIHELDKNDFIFCSQINCGDSLGGPAHNILIIDKINIKEINKKERLSQKRREEYFDDDGNYNKENKRVIESLKFTHNTKELLKYSEYGKHHFFKGNAILKNEYFLISIDNNILIFDIYSGKHIKRYVLLLEGEDNLYKRDANLIKWNNNNDNEFLINIEGSIFLFELTNDIQLKIISQFNSKDIISLKNFGKITNKFYDDGSDDENYLFLFYYAHSDDNNENNENNENNTISIFS